MRQIFILLTGGASFNVVLYPGSHARPVIFTVDLPDGFISSWVTSGRTVVPYLHELSF